jgi:regulator of sigma E protease
MVSLAAVLSVGVGLFNLLPLPVLDGGHIVYSTFEMFTGKPVSERIQGAAGTISMAFLLGMAVMVTWFDIQRITAP